MTKPQLDSLLILIKRNYIEGETSLRYLSKVCGYSDVTIKKVMVENGINFVKAKRKLSESHKEKLKKNLISSRSECRDKKILLICSNHKYANPEYLLKFDDLEKFSLLNGFLNNRHKSKFYNEEYFFSFIDRFYDCKEFNHIYDNWIRNNKNTDLRPSLDHLIPLSRGGTWDLDNLGFKTWFENRCKGTMTESEWSERKENLELFFINLNHINV